MLLNVCVAVYHRLSVVVDQSHFMAALDGFVASSLRDISLLTSSTSFADIGGMEEIKNILKETIEFPTKFQKLFEKVPIKMRSGLLLYGPPGTGMLTI